MSQLSRSYDVYVKHSYTVAIPKRRGNKNAVRPIDNKVKGVLSYKSKRKMQDVLIGWNEVIRCAPLDNKKKWHFKPRFTMLTLTLSSKQLHPDSTIKQKLLNPYLTALKKVLGRNLLYIWSAETQPIKTQNIHFHIVMDRYVDMKWAQAVWNRIQDRLNYVENSGLTNPPSTHITQININKKSVGYLMKYLSKTNEKGRKVQGKLWGCSQSLLKLNVCVKAVYIDMDVSALECEAGEKGLKIFYPSPYVMFIPHNAKERRLLYGDEFDRLLEDSAQREYSKIAPIIESYRFIKFAVG